MTLHMVTCPLCCQPGFNTSVALCSALISASTRKLFCPVCNEMLIGLDKLTIHLFGHNTSVKSLTNSSSSQTSACLNIIAAQNSSEDVANSNVAPVLYIQSDNGQLFALAPSIVNQFGSVTINTQNCVNASVCGDNLASHSVSEKKLPECASSGAQKRGFSSCKDLLTLGDFSEPYDEPSDVIEPGNTSQTEEFSTIDAKSQYTPPTTKENLPDGKSGLGRSKELADSQPLAEEVTTPSPKPLVPCDVCEMGFSNMAILAVHKQLMHKNLTDLENGAHRSEKSRKKPLNCNYCPATFNLKSSLIIHVKVTHPAQKESFERKDGEKVTCPVCTKTFPKESTLNQHMKAVHGDKPWQCTVCSKSFTTKYFLRKHKRIHTGETPYECAICHKVFTFQQSYHKHMLYHTDDKPYCCSHCGRLFKELSTLNNHERIHSGEKPFACETCGKCFRQRVSYLVHRRIHTGDMPYKCTACNKPFRYKISQRTHKCTEHPPGIVVKTHSTLVDRLQAAMDLGERMKEGQIKSVEATGRSTPFGEDVASPSTSLKMPEKLIDAKSMDKFPVGNPSSDNLDSSRSRVSQSDLNLVMNRGEGSNPPINSADQYPQLFHFDEMEAADKTKSSDEVDIFSMNLDSSPSECLGKLHISSQESPPTLPHPSLGFDNMEDLDLCNLLFDIS